jgi:TetR/AcrR family transcriptional repressor of lmrAB and yxaGH operons
MCSELSTRERMVRAACELLETQGYHATGLNEILQRSDTPRGSLYYYFPEGKEELAAEAIERQGRLIEAGIRADLAAVENAAAAVQGLFFKLAQHVESSGCRMGGPITAVALESSTTNERLRQVCAQIYDAWRTAFEEKLLASGYPATETAALSTLILSVLEGATTLSRTLRSALPLQQAGEQLGRLLTLVRDASS